MQSSNTSVSVSPKLPEPFSLPLKLLSAKIHSRFLVGILNKIFINDLKDGEMDFLQDKAVAIEVSDMGLSYHLTLCGDVLKEISSQDKYDLLVRASLYDFMSMSSRQVDPDTLVFQRRLVMEGDTELGLALKNYLDAMDVESSRVLSTIESVSRKTMPVYKKLFG